jgi:hypothetical protein
MSRCTLRHAEIEERVQWAMVGMVRDHISSQPGQLSSCNQGKFREGKNIYRPAAMRHPTSQQCKNSLRQVISLNTARARHTSISKATTAVGGYEKGCLYQLEEEGGQDDHLNAKAAAQVPGIP